MRPYGLALLCLVVAACSCGESQKPKGEGGSGGSAQDAQASGGSSGWPIPDSGSGGSLADAKTDADSAPPKLHPDYAWLFAPGAWTPLSVVPGCDVREVDAKKAGYPGLQWKSCGSGCQESDVLGGDKLNGAYALNSGTSVEKDKWLGLFSVVMRIPPALRGVVAIDLNSNVLVSALITLGDKCLMTSFGTGTRAIGASLTTTKEYRPGLLPLQPSKKTDWLLPKVPLGSPHSFHYDGGWGSIVNQGSIGVTDSTTSSTLTTVYSSPTFQTHEVAQGDLVVWMDYQPSGSPLRGWTKAGGARVFAKGAWHATQHALSPEKIVWVGATGPGVASGAYQSAQLFWTERKLDPDAISVQSGPKLGLTSYSGRIATAGNWAALRHCSSQTCDVLLADLNANKLWRVPGRQGRLFKKLLGMNEKYVLVAEGPVQNGQLGSAVFDRFVQYEIAKLSSYAKAEP